jgi:hypothetical protein
LRDLRLGTDWYQIDSFSTNAQHDSPYGSLIGQHRKTPHGGATLGESSDRETAVSIIENVTGTNLGASIDRRVRESQQHEH